MQNCEKKWLYPQNLEEAAESQRVMAQIVETKDAFVRPITRIAGMDISTQPFDPEERVFASVVVLSYPDLQVLEIATTSAKQKFPYIPGFLGFREAPALITAFRSLSLVPDIILIDGHGISHPRGLGIASHIGVLLNIPTIGVAKSILVGSPKGDLPSDRGGQVPLVWKGQEIARLLRSKKRCLPLIISSGHKICLSTAMDIVMGCLRGYRLPEPTRQAHLAANRLRVEKKA